MTSPPPPHEDTTEFRNSRDVRIQRVPQQRRPYLVMIRAGSQPRSSFFSTPIPEHRIFDVALNYYAPPPSDDVGFRTGDIVFGGGLSKFHAAKLFFEKTRYHERYKGVLFLDDDLELLFELDEFFKFCESQKLHLAQPSVSNASDSFCDWPITRNHPGFVMRITNFVEVMAPFFARDFLKAMLHSFDMSISSWGLDMYWGHHLGSAWRAAIIDQFEIKHKKPFSATGPFYEYLKSIGVDPNAEVRKIFDKLGLDHYNIQPIQFMYRVHQLVRPR
jgi:hypothetical protein